MGEFQRTACRITVPVGERSETGLLSQELKKKVLRAQKNEITEYLIYDKLSALVDDRNRAAIKKISEEELAHYAFWKGLTKEDVRPNRAKVFFYPFIARILGLSFSLKAMESGEDLAQKHYNGLKSINPEIERIIGEEGQHESQLLDLIDDERLKYSGSVMLGLSDALVELTSALCGFTLALANQKLITIMGLITGIAASLSMAGSSYLSAKEEGGRNALKSCVYTGAAYIITVLLLIAPYLFFKNSFLSLFTTVIFAVTMIFLFTFYVSVAKNLNFKKRFLEMFSVAIGAAALNFLIGFLVRKYLDINV